MKATRHLELGGSFRTSVIRRMLPKIDGTGRSIKFLFQAVARNSLETLTPLRERWALTADDFDLNYTESATTNLGSTFSQLRQFDDLDNVVSRRLQ